MLFAWTSPGCLRLSFAAQPNDLVWILHEEWKSACACENVCVCVCLCKFFPVGSTCTVADQIELTGRLTAHTRTSSSLSDTINHTRFRNTKASDMHFIQAADLNWMWFFFFYIIIFPLLWFNGCWLYFILKLKTSAQGQCWSDSFYPEHLITLEIASLIHTFFPQHSTCVCVCEHVFERLRETNLSGYFLTTKRPINLLQTTITAQYYT